MKKKAILLGIVFFTLGFWLGYSGADKDSYIEKESAKNNLAEINQEIKTEPETKSPEAIYLNPRLAQKNIFPGENAQSFKTKGIISARYAEDNLPPGKSDELYMEYWGDKNTIKSIRLKEPLFEDDKIRLLIQTYTWAPTGARYSFDNFQFFERPYKTRSGLYAYISRFDPPAAVIAIPKDDRFLVVTSDNAKTLLRALNSLRVG